MSENDKLVKKHVKKRRSKKVLKDKQGWQQVAKLEKIRPLSLLGFPLNLTDRQTDIGADGH